MRLIDADALERDGWKMSRTVQVSKDTMEFQTRKPTDFPTIEPQRMRGKWIPQGWNDTYCKCSCCDAVYVTAEIPYSFCPNCGADMRGEQDVNH